MSDDRERFAYWLDGFAKAESRDRRAAEFLLNNFEKAICLLTSDRDDKAEDRLHDLRIDWYVSEEGRR